MAQEKASPEKKSDAKDKEIDPNKTKKKKGKGRTNSEKKEKKNYSDTSNHPEWLDKKVSYMAQPFVEFNKAIPMGLSAGAHGEIRSKSSTLVTAYHTGISTYCADDIFSTFDATITEIYNSVVAIIGRTPTWTKGDLVAYWYNMRVIYSNLAHLIKSYEYFFETKTDDTSLPYSLIQGANFDATVDNINTVVETELANARLLLIKVADKLASFPIFGDVFKSDVWMFGTTFLDDNSRKPTYIMHVPSLTNSAAWHGSTQTYVLTNEAGENFQKLTAFTQYTIPNTSFYDYVVALSQQLDRNVAQASSRGTLMSDLMLSFSNDMALDITSKLINRVSVTIPRMSVTHDAYMLKQLQNATLIFGLLPDNVYYDNSMQFTSPSVGITCYQADIGATLSIYPGLYIPSGANVPTKEWWAKCYKIAAGSVGQVNYNGVNLKSAGEVLSATRLTVTYNLNDLEGVNESTTIFRILSCGTNFLLYVRNINVQATIPAGTQLMPTLLSAPSAYPRFGFISMPAELEASAGFWGTFARAFFRSGLDVDNRPKSMAITSEESPTVVGNIPMYIYPDWDKDDTSYLSPENIANRHAMTTSSLLQPVYHSKSYRGKQLTGDK